MGRTALNVILLQGTNFLECFVVIPWQAQNPMEMEAVQDALQDV
jgi:hypothetical protein